jgi:hypothetical protein
MDVYINQLERGIDRIIMPQFPEIDHYRIDMKEHNGWNYMGIIYVPIKMKKWNDWENLEEDMWRSIVTQTKRYYDATSHDEHYILAAVGELKEPVETAPVGTPPPIKWWWKLDSEKDWRDRRDRNAQFYMYRRHGIE